MWVGSEQEQVQGDLVLPVSYQTLPGAFVDCTYVAFLNTPAGRGDLREALAHLTAQDWSTFGEEVKRYALDHPVTDSDAGWEHADQEMREQAAFSMAAAAVVLQRAHELLPDDTAVTATSDCEGVLS
ncbi:MAG: hypothetical protein EOO27_17270 [Comamonadaceae bacterium]|nr:MAG: hypothetical protein EOO27_17270 [Comamonadaceae bacterium]